MNENLKVKFNKTDHAYYCEAYCTHKLSEYESWEDFYDEWGNSNEDYNLLFRFDIKEQYTNDEEEELIEGTYIFMAFFMLQRKGIYVPVEVRNLKEKDMVQVNEFLQKRYDYMIKNVWKEFSEKGED